MNQPLDKFEKVAIEAAKAGGKILSANFASQSHVEAKGKHDVVTATDRASEQEIINCISSHFPKHTIVAEESGTHDNQSEYVWIIDPLDGTSNFVTGNPYFSVSIALAYKNEVNVGVVFNPITNELYVAKKGCGAYVNGEKINVSEKSDLTDSIVTCAYAAEDETIVAGLEMIKNLALNSRKVIINFSPALDLCNIARGRIDGIVDAGTEPEDHAAGCLILSEAGGMVTNFDNNEWDVSKVGILAANKELHSKLRNMIHS
jgi:myo-inositol-1(or 4)-monophosphatase